MCLPPQPTEALQTPPVKAMGQVLSDTCGVAFGGTIEACALKLGLPLPGLTDAQQRLGAVKRVSTLGGRNSGMGMALWRIETWRGLCYLKVMSFMSLDFMCPQLMYDSV